MDKTITNGDIIKLLFTNASFEYDTAYDEERDTHITYVVMEVNDEYVCDFSVDWWNKAYTGRLVIDRRTQENK